MSMNKIDYCFNKIKSRLKEPNRTANRKKASDWCKKNSIDTMSFLVHLDKNLAKEAADFNNILEKKAKEFINKVPFQMGGGANSLLLYFFTRYFRPEIIVETGVSLGLSTHAFLTAINRNKKGKLFSSDLPYFAHKDSRKYIGAIVPEELKNHWELYLEGDKKNLELIKNKITRMDIFHYDSDKSIYGRKNALKQLSPLITENTVLIFDDIQMNLHFKKIADTNKNTIVLTKNQKDYVGIVFPKSYKVLTKL